MLFLVLFLVSVCGATTVSFEPYCIENGVEAYHLSEKLNDTCHMIKSSINWSFIKLNEKLKTIKLEVAYGNPKIGVGVNSNAYIALPPKVYEIYPDTRQYLYNNNLLHLDIYQALLGNVPFTSIDELAKVLRVRYGEFYLSDINPVTRPEMEKRGYTESNAIDFVGSGSRYIDLKIRKKPNYNHEDHVEFIKMSLLIDFILF